MKLCAKRVLKTNSSIQALGTAVLISEAPTGSAKVGIVHVNKLGLTQPAHFPCRVL